MFYREKFKIQLKDIGKDNYIKNRAILEVFENIGTYHSDIVGYGPNDIKKTGVTWILLDWKLKVIKRPKYGELLDVCTWGRTMKKIYTYRDFEIYNENNEICVIGTSKWALIDIERGKLAKLNEDLINLYDPEEKNVFNENELKRISIPQTFLSEYVYKVSRRDIDLNSHMHNLYYLDLAYETLPEDIYEKRPYNDVRIEYRKEVKLGDIIKCKYSFENDQNIVTIMNNDEDKIHAIITLK